MSDLEEIKKRKLAELQEQQKKEEYELLKQTVLRQVLTQKARERLSTLKMTKPELVDKIETQLVALAQNGKIREKIDDEKIKALLIQVQPKKREMRIRRI